jgi:two-component system cell cycle sensor histidine kinase/response regulator CckA
MNLARLTSPGYVREIKAIWSAGTSGGDGHTHEIQFVSRDGRQLLFEARHSVLREGEQPVAVQGILRDVTEKRRLEDQLQQSQRMEAVGQLAAGVAHHLNNQLTTILGYCDLIMSDLKPNTSHHGMLRQVRTAGMDAASIIAQLLAFGRKQIRRVELLDVNDLLGRQQKMLQPLMGDQIRLVVDLDENLGRVMADAGQMRQVITNLVMNARDAMSDGGRIILRTRNCGNGNRCFCKAEGTYGVGECVCIFVIDEGCGIPKELQERVFEPFFTTKDVGQGTGLGLSTVQGIVSQSGGLMRVESEPGRGSTFAICLPCVRGLSEGGRRGIASAPAV